MASSDLSPSILSLLENQYPGLISVLLNSGIEPTDPTTLRANLVDLATQLSPGLTTELPGTLLSNIASTTIGALAQIDSAKVEAVNSVSPLNAPSTMLDDFGSIYGVFRGEGTNPSAYIDITGTPGLFLAAGFQFTDNQYIFETQQNLTIPTSGVLPNIYVRANQTGDYIIPPFTITQPISAIASNATLEVTNPQYGSPGTGQESDENYRARILQAGQATCQGTPNFIRTCVQNVPNVIGRSVSVQVVRDGENNPAGYSVQADGGDPMQVAGAIYESCFDLPNLKRSVNKIAGATQSNPCIISTILTHGLKDGQDVVISDAQGMTAINGTFKATLIDASRFSIPLDMSGSAAYSGSGVLKTNPRDMTTTISDGRDHYDISFIRPLQQRVKVTCHWQTSALNIIDNDAAIQLCTPAIANYINSIQGGDPINMLQLGTVFEAAILQLIPQNLITELSFEVYLDDVLTPPRQNSHIISGDPQSYFVTTADQITLVRN